jgi:hypothetical protein
MLLVALVSSSCPRLSPQTVFTVEELEPRIDELDGHTVSVVGYLAECGGYDCRLYPNKADADEWGRFMTAIQAGQHPPVPSDHPVVGIGSGTSFDFDARAAPFMNGYVVITGTVSNECRYQGKPACTDRSPDINPTSIRAGPPIAGQVR